MSFTASKLLAKPPDGLAQEYTLQQLQEEFLKGKVSADWLARKTS